MRIKRARPVGSEHISNSYINREGYPDPTASCAIKNIQRDKKKLSAKAKNRMKKTEGDARRRFDGQRKTGYQGNRQTRS